MEELLKELNLTGIKGTEECILEALDLTMKNETFTQNKILKVLKILLEKNINSNIKDNLNVTILRLAIEKRMKNVLNFSISRNNDKHLVARFFIEGEHMKLTKLSEEDYHCNRHVRHSINRDSIQKTITEGATFVEWLISKGLDFDCEYDKSKSGLYMAIEQNLPHILPAILIRTRDINFVDKENRTLLHLYLENCSKYYDDSVVEILNSKLCARIVKIFLDRGISADAEDSNKCTPTQMAIKNMNIDISVVGILVERCTKIKHEGVWDESLLQLVIERFSTLDEWRTEKCLKILEFLIVKGADIKELNEPDEWSFTPLCFAVEKRNVKLVNFLQENAADFSVRTKCGKNLLHLLVNNSYYEETDEDAALIIFHLLINKGCQVNAKDEAGKTPLYEAINRGNVAIVRKLIEHGAEVNYKGSNNSDHTLLQMAANESYHPLIIDLLLKSGADCRVITGNGETLLHLLAKSNCMSDEGKLMQIFDHLVNEGCYVNARALNGNTPLHYAVVCGNVTVMLKLIELGADVNCETGYGATPLHKAANIRDNLSVVRLLGESGADFSVKTRGGKNLLHLLAKSGNMATDDHEHILFFKLLLSKYCQVKAKDETGTTPIHLAAAYACTALVQLLIEHGAEINSRNDLRETPLHFASAAWKREEMVELLLENGTNVDARNTKGQTALHVAAEGPQGCSVGTMKLLLEHGANIDLNDEDGRSALYRAVNKNVGHFGVCYGNVRAGDADRYPYKLTYCGDVEVLMKHWIKLDVAKLKCYAGNEYENLAQQEKYMKYREKCLKEIQALKNTFIDDYTSLYSLLHMDLNSRRVYVNNEKLQQLVQSPKLEKQFSEYAVLILAGYREAVTRKSLLAPAKEAWLELTKISLPEECIELVFSFLSNSDLFVIIEKQ